MPTVMYGDHGHWQRIQHFLPEPLRCVGEHLPEEEFWAWGSSQIHLDRHADPDAPVKLVVLHGGGGNGRLLAPVGIAARGAAETVAPDLPGYGHTRTPDRRGITYDDWVTVVDDLVHFEVERDGRPVVLFGASMGGMLAVDVAARSDHVVGVIATCLLDPRDPQVRRAVVRHPTLARAIPILLRSEPVLGRVRVPVRLLANMRAIANDPALATALIADRTAAGARVPLGFLISWLTSQRPIAPADFDVPVLLVHPGDDRWTPASLSQVFLGRIGAPTTYVELANCGHVPVEEPGLSQMQDAVRTFLDDVVRSPDARA